MAGQLAVVREGRIRQLIISVPPCHLMISTMAPVSLSFSRL
jgi:hypothetical protein